MRLYLNDKVLVIVAAIVFLLLVFILPFNASSLTIKNVDNTEVQLDVLFKDVETGVQVTFEFPSGAEPDSQILAVWLGLDESSLRHNQINADNIDVAQTDHAVIIADIADGFRSSNDERQDSLVDFELDLAIFPEDQSLSNLTVLIESANLTADDFQSAGAKILTQPDALHETVLTGMVPPVPVPAPLMLFGVVLLILGSFRLAEVQNAS